ncbi:hypothetical protein ILYODFUR_037802 [Ilyodon furcidens]|uniref:Uncharacterized protein n=1 Tax=Ilyodon furcidens TaxID=33524 RepID=A0ABV0STA6_9TELE
MAVYDENILKNPFYLALEKQRPDLSSRVADFHGIVLVPCCGSLTVSSYSDSHFDGYVLQPVEEGYKTVNGKVCYLLYYSIKLYAYTGPSQNISIL